MARDAFTTLVTGPNPLGLDGRPFPGLPDRRLPLPQVRALLLARSCPQQTRDAVWRELVTRSRREGGAWTAGCVGVALPALTRSAAQLTARFAEARLAAYLLEVDSEPALDRVALTTDLSASRPRPRRSWLQTTDPTQIQQAGVSGLTGTMKQGLEKVMRSAR